MNGRRRLQGIGLGIFLAGAVGAAAPGDLSGRWKLNRDASDDPRKKTEEARAQADNQGGGGFRGGGRMGRHGGGRRGGDSPGKNEPSGAMETPDAAEMLRIDHRDPKLVITEGGGREHVLYTDGRKVEEERSFGGTTKITARWKDGHVVVETKPEHGPTYSETYAVTADHKQLTVTRRIPGRGGRRDVEIRRIYDAAASEQEPIPQPPPAASSPRKQDRPVSAGEARQGLAPLSPVRLEPDRLVEGRTSPLRLPEPLLEKGQSLEHLGAARLG